MGVIIIRLCSPQVPFVSECRARPFVCWERSAFAFHFHLVGRWEQKCQRVPLGGSKEGNWFLAGISFFPPVNHKAVASRVLAILLLFISSLNVAAGSTQLLTETLASEWLCHGAALALYNRRRSAWAQSEATDGGKLGLSHFSKPRDSVALSGVVMLISGLINLSLSMRTAWNFDQASPSRMESLGFLLAASFPGSLGQLSW